MALNIEQVAKLGALHAELEGEQDLQGVMDTLGPEPVYEYPSLGKKFVGRDRSLRFYTWFFANFSPNVVGYTLIGEWVNADSVAQEYSITLEFDGKRETHRVLGVLVVEGDKLGGERVYGSEALIRRMIGPLFEELEPL